MEILRVLLSAACSLHGLGNQGFEKALSTVARGGASHARNARRWVSCPRQPLSCKIVSTADTHVSISAELARWFDGHIARFAIDARRKMLLASFAGSQDTEHRFTLAESARLMPVTASPLLATSSAKAGLIS